ncbi:phosphoglycerate kinase [Candidatus Roizmanbacteria bacterium CG10_big_fil_rev_8_21_14_0_10_39_6]|uniref:Phosphoglycerate kinase n=1 Tax=Candidatus Roizmanbacteria bacterium CG10_big_fil_rev_8_21_14_0_10_39_6 TaxID=1974853 RepID=A0A2M8KR83_9BACT|nr:MAG: phosphoglycerate kinase [Candidatus Roizmanbacteria bacterium CG10_big_fil_rev_8_21_14_0_10_39_6]
MKFIDEVAISNKRVLLRVDFNVSLNPDYTIADDARIKQSIPTILYLLERNNTVIIVSHLDRPKKRDSRLSLVRVARDLHTYLPGKKVVLIDDFTKDTSLLEKKSGQEVYLLENIRFYPEEEKNDSEFVKKLAVLADVYVNDAFGVSHRANASIVAITKELPSYGGLLMKREIEMISKVVNKPKKPVVAIVGGAKISTKIEVLSKLIEIADYLILGGGLANTFLCAQGIPIGKSYCETTEVEQAKKVLFMAAQKNTMLVLPQDAIVGNPADVSQGGHVTKVENTPHNGQILDIGPETQAQFGTIIAKAKTLIWNGPVGYIENPMYRRGTDFIYYSIAQNHDCVSVVGGGDTLAAISKKEYLNTISHISTGGGAMLEFIEKGTLPGIEALG